MRSRCDNRFFERAQAPPVTVVLPPLCVYRVHHYDVTYYFDVRSLYDFSIMVKRISSSLTFAQWFINSVMQRSRPFSVYLVPLPSHRPVTKFVNSPLLLGDFASKRAIFHQFVMCGVMRVIIDRVEVGTEVGFMRTIDEPLMLFAGTFTFHLGRF